jgi:hypothetical protein
MKRSSALPPDHPEYSSAGARLSKGGALVGSGLGMVGGLGIGALSNRIGGFSKVPARLNLAASTAVGTLAAGGSGGAHGYMAGQLGSAAFPDASLFDQAVVGRATIGAAKSTGLGPVFAAIGGAVGALRGAADAGATHLVEKFSQEMEGTPALDSPDAVEEEAPKWKIRMPSPAAQGVRSGSTLGALAGAGIMGVVGARRHGMEAPLWAAFDTFRGGVAGGALGGIAGGVVGGIRGKQSSAARTALEIAADFTRRRQTGV